jgi:hypothetical protein
LPPNPLWIRVPSFSKAKVSIILKPVIALLNHLHCSGILLIMIHFSLFVIICCIPKSFTLFIGYFDTGYKVYIGPGKYFVTSDVGSGRIQWYAFLALPAGTYFSTR